MLSRRELGVVTVILAVTAVVLWTALKERVKAPRASSEADRYLCQETSLPFFAQERPGSPFIVAGRPGAIPFRFRMPKPAGIFRVFIVCPSVAQNLGAMRWRGGLPSGRKSVEFINCAMPGYTIPRFEAIVSEIRGYAPDAVVVLSGNHERFSYDPCPSRRVRKALKAIPEPFGSWAYLQKAHELDLRLFEEALRRIIRTVRGAGAAAVVCTLPANIRDYPPRVPSEQVEPFPAMGPGRLSDSIALLKQRLARDPRDPLDEYFLARAFDKAGDLAEARRHYMRAMELDFYGDRCSPVRNALIRSVAGSEGAALADLEKIFEALAPDGLVGDTLIADAYHWHHALDDVAGWAVVDAVAGRGSAAAPRRAGGAPTAAGVAQEYEAMHASTLNVLNFHLAWRGREEVCEELISLLSRLMARDAERLSAATPEGSQRAFGKMWWTDRAAKDGWWPSYLFHLGETFRRRGDDRRALEFFDRAVGLSRLPIFLAHRAMALEGLGRRSEGLADLCSALAEASEGGKTRHRKYILELARRSGSALSVDRCSR